MTEKEFIQNFINEFQSTNIDLSTKDKVKKFPDDFIEGIECKVIHISNKIFIIGDNFFGKYEIVSVDGNSVINLPTYEEAKYIVYASRNKIDKVLIPKDYQEMKSVLTNYEKYIDSIILKISTEYNKHFSKINGTSRSIDDNLNNIVNNILRILNLVRY